MSEELKLVRCGCGGEAKVSTWTGSNATVINDCNAVYCENCGIQTKKYNTETEAIRAWNRAMGERTIKVTDTWKIAGYDELNAWCPECEHRITRGCSYCPTCGARLEWE